jgi:hypothetical protein
MVKAKMSDKLTRTPQPTTGPNRTMPQVWHYPNDRTAYDKAMAEWWMDVEDNPWNLTPEEEQMHDNDTSVISHETGRRLKAKEDVDGWIKFLNTIPAFKEGIPAHHRVAEVIRQQGRYPLRGESAGSPRA